jgi:HK97 family phage major capsid protein
MPDDTGNQNRPTAGSVETRALDTLSADAKRLRGLIPYGVESRDMGGFREVIEPGALNNARLDDLIATVDHRGLPLGRYPGTLQLEDRSDGLHWSVEPPESRADVREAVERGDLRAGSWRMVVGRDEWRGDVRHVHEIAELRDVAVATNPAYRDAAVELRTAPENDNDAGERRQEGGNMPADNQDGAAEDRSAENTESEERTENQDGEERSAEQRTGTLTVESRSETTEERSVEERVVEALLSVRKGEARSLSVASDGAIAPPELSTMLFEKLRASSVALQSGIVVVPTDRSEVQWPKLTADVAPDFYGEGETITPGDPTFATLTANPHKLAHIVEASNEVIDDSEPSVVDVLNGHLATMLGLKLDSAIYEGNPAGNPDSITGLKFAPGIQTVDLGANGAALTNYDPFVEAVGLLQAANVPGPYVVVFHPRTATELALLKQESGSEQQLAPPAGFPQVFATSQLSITETKGTESDASSAYVYAPSQLVLVRRQDATIELDRSRLFNSDQSEVRGKLRADLLTPNPTAVVRIEGIIPAA